MDLTSFFFCPPEIIAFLFFFLAYTWTDKVDNVDTCSAAHINTLQTEKVDRDGNIPFTQGAWFDAEYDNGNSGASKTIDWNNGKYQVITLTADTVTISFTDPSPGVGSVQLRIVQDGTGSRTITWPGTVLWSGGTAPTLTTTASAEDIVTLFYNDTNYYGTAIFDFS